MALLKILLLAPVFAEAKVRVVTVISAQRSASTALQGRISELSNGAVVSWNELFNVGPSQTGNSREFIPPELFWSRCRRPVDALTAGLQRLCERKGRDDCAIVFKLFPVHCLRWHDLAQQLRDILTFPDTLPVILERDPAARECSLNWANRTNDWGTSPEGHKEFALGHDLAERPPCPETASGDFLQKHDAWFALARRTLRNASLPHLEVPAEAYTTGLKTTDDIARWVLRSAGFSSA